MKHRDKLGHALLACMFVLVAWLVGNPLAGAAAGVALFFGREHAQAVNKLKMRTNRWNMQPDLERQGLKFWEWNEDGRWDWYASLAAIPLAVVLQYFPLWG